MLIIVDADVNALVGKEKNMRVKAFLAPIEPYRSLLLAFRRRFTFFSLRVRPWVLARQLDDLKVHVLDVSPKAPVALLRPHLLHSVADSGRRGGGLHRHR